MRAMPVSKWKVAEGRGRGNGRKGAKNTVNNFNHGGERMRKN